MKLKKIIISVTDDTHAKFRIQLKQDSIEQSPFLRMVVESYIEQDPELLAYINKKFEKRRNGRTKKYLAKQQEIKQQVIEDFALNEEEIKNIFDIIEAEEDD